MSAATTEIVYPRGRQARAFTGRWMGPLLTPLSWLYGSAVPALARVGRLGEKAAAIAGRVISVGNIDVGGNGKTPMTMWLMAQLMAAGRSVCYVSRGFGGIAGKVSAPTVLPPEGDEIAGPRGGTRELRRDHPSLARAASDEAAMVAARFPSVPLVLGRNKRAAVAAAVELFDAEYVVVDDAFQTWGLARDVDLLLLDGARPLGDGRLLPAGHLREEPSALARADIIAFNDVAGTEDIVRATRQVRRHTRAGTLYCGLKRRTVLMAPIPVESAPTGAVAVLSAIARPERFESAVREHVQTVLAIRYPDHHAYTDEDVRRLEALCEERGIGTLVTTEKDRTKLPNGAIAGISMWTARLDVDVIGDDPMPRVVGQ